MGARLRRRGKTGSNGGEGHGCHEAALKEGGHCRAQKIMETVAASRKKQENRHCPYYGRVWTRKGSPDLVLGDQVRKQDPKTGAEGWELKSEEVKQRPGSSPWT